MSSDDFFAPGCNARCALKEEEELPNVGLSLDTVRMEHDRESDRFEETLCLVLTKYGHDNVRTTFYRAQNLILNRILELTLKLNLSVSSLL